VHSTEPGREGVSVCVCVLFCFVLFLFCFVLFCTKVVEVWGLLQSLQQTVGLLPRCPPGTPPSDPRPCLFGTVTKCWHTQPVPSCKSNIATNGPATYSLATNCLDFLLFSLHTVDRTSLRLETGGHLKCENISTLLSSGPHLSYIIPQYVYTFSTFHCHQHSFVIYIIYMSKNCDNVNAAVLWCWAQPSGRVVGSCKWSWQLQPQELEDACRRAGSLFHISLVVNILPADGQQPVTA